MPQSSWKKYTKCPICDIDWLVKYTYDIEGNIDTERQNFNQTELTDKEHNSLTRTVTCGGCGMIKTSVIDMLTGETIDKIIEGVNKKQDTEMKETYVPQKFSEINVQINKDGATSKDIDDIIKNIESQL
jgi:uncharacterized protein YpmB